VTNELPEDCAGCGESLVYFVQGTRYSKATSVEIRGVYDGGLFHAHTVESGGCGFAWHRWSPDVLRERPLFLKAQPFINRWNRRYYELDPYRAEGLGHPKPV